MKTLLTILLLCASALALSIDPNGIQSADDVVLPQSLTKDIIKSMWSVLGKVTGRRRTVPLSPAGRVEVNTPSGKVMGILSSTFRNQVSYASFLGMPYAVPPVNELRFEPPVESTPWEGTRDGTYERPSCFQYLGTDLESEDCLYVNVYTPKLGNESLLPVMVFIHGGAFIMGSSNSSIYSPDFLIEKGIVLVTFNYRLGVLGFLSFQTEKVPGNNGLKDQVLALKWVQKHIRSFGGDPNSVTIFGESAGAASVHYHVMSKASKGLFHKAIMQSGAVTNPWASVPQDHSVKLAQNFANQMGCRQTTDDAVLNCLRKIPARQLTDEQQNAMTASEFLTLNPFAFTPTVEPKFSGAFLSESPLNLMQRGDYNHVPMIIGANSRESLIILPVINKVDPLGFMFSLITHDLSLFYPSELRRTLGIIDRQKIHKEMKRFYTSSNFLSKKDMVLNIISDTCFNVPIVHSAALMANYSTQPIYNYLFSYDGGYGFYKKRLGLEKEFGVCHADELGYLFYDEDYHMIGGFTKRLKPWNDKTSIEDEKKIDLFTRMWTNFAKTGNPTPTLNNDVTVRWEPFTPPFYKSIDIGRVTEMKEGIHRNMMNFWLLLLKMHPEYSSL